MQHIEHTDLIDDIQSHILGVIASLMVSYNLKPHHVQARYEYITSLNPNDVTASYEESTSPVRSQDSTEEGEVNNLTPISSGKSWADYDDDDDSIEVNVSPMDIDDHDDLEDGEEEHQTQEEESPITPTYPIYVSTRRQFCSTMQQGIKICPRYSTCKNKFCKHFHVKDEHICPHLTRGSYCDTDGCDMIVIRACRKGKKCNDSECSFRHR